jgi:hypothetical protein
LTGTSAIAPSKLILNMAQTPIEFSEDAEVSALSYKFSSVF